MGATAPKKNSLVLCRGLLNFPTGDLKHPYKALQTSVRWGAVSEKMFHLGVFPESVVFGFNQSNSVHILELKVGFVPLLAGQTNSKQTTAQQELKSTPLYCIAPFSASGASIFSINLQKGSLWILPPPKNSSRENHKGFFCLANTELLYHPMGISTNPSGNLWATHNAKISTFSTAVRCEVQSTIRQCWGQVVRPERPILRFNEEICWPEEMCQIRVVGKFKRISI